MEADLFAPAELAPSFAPKVLTVSEVTRAVRDAIEGSVGQVWVQGEICNHRRQASGHQYFTLKDERSQLPCVLFFKPALRRRTVALSDGMLVQAHGAMTVYEARGQYQLNVEVVQPAGAGLLQAKFEALKRKLAAEGLFEQARKRPLPKFPARLAIVTSPTGAALRDMLNILRRRAPWIEILIEPVRVQGEGAGEEIARAVVELNRASGTTLPTVDLIVLARGGGSAEDLWAFNDEKLAHAIHESALPVVSAVGHEIDFTIADLVADLRAPTPSAAAEIVAPDAEELGRHFRQFESRLTRKIAGVVATSQARLSSLSRGTLMREPQRLIGAAWQRVDYAAEVLRRDTLSSLTTRQNRLRTAFAALREHRPDQIIAAKHREIELFSRTLSELWQRRLTANRERLAKTRAMLRIMAPQATLDRGYSITRTKTGKVIRSTAQVGPKMDIITQVGDGEFASRASAKK